MKLKQNIAHNLTRINLTLHNIKDRKAVSIKISKNAIYRLSRFS